jgi:hypothetical protein
MAACGDRGRAVPAVFAGFRRSLCGAFAPARDEAALGAGSERAERAEGRADVFAFAMSSLLKPKSRNPNPKSHGDRAFECGW